MSLSSIKKAKNLKGKRVLVRVDLNVPIKNGKVMDDFKINHALPVINYLRKKKARIILMSHLGMLHDYDPVMSMLPVHKALQKKLGTTVLFIKFSNGKTPKLSNRKIKLENGGMALLENVRFSPDEKKNTGDFAKELASTADIYVLDGFASAHRASASVVGATEYLPSYAGFLMVEEIKVLSKIIKKPKKPLVVLLGGAKLKTKIPVLKNLLPVANHILVAGGIANTYFWAKGNKVGGSLISKDFKKEILAYSKNKKVVVPLDIVVGDKSGRRSRVINTKQKFSLKRGEAIYDIGPETVKLFAAHIKKARTLIWNGAMGMFEQHPYGFGTNSIADLFAARAKGKAFGVAGGGETVEVLRARDIFDQVDLVSTGGGAMLEFLGGKKLPGVEALNT